MKRRLFLAGITAALIATSLPAAAKTPLTENDVNRIVHLWGRALIIDRDVAKAWYRDGNHDLIMKALGEYCRRYNGTGCSINVLMDECRQMNCNDINQVLWGLEHAQKSVR